MNYRKGYGLLFLILFLVLIILLIGTISHFISPKTVVISDQSPTLGWKTYSNTQNSFEIKYPDDWFILRNYQGGLRLANFKEDNNTTTNSWSTLSPGGMEININQGICNKPTDSFIVQGNRADITVEVICTDNFQITLQLLTNDTQKVEHEKLLEQIAGTFKFIENSVKNGIYINPKFGYTLHYPINYLLIDNYTYDEQTVYTSNKLLTNTPEWLTVEIHGHPTQGTFADGDLEDFGKTQQDFINISSANLNKYCDSDGPTGSTYCQKISKQSSFMTTNGVTCYELYLLEEGDNGQNNNSINSIVDDIGPFYSCDITKQTNNKARALFVIPWLRSSRIDLTKIKDFINGIAF